MTKFHRIKVTLDIPSDIITNATKPVRAIKALLTAALCAFRITVVSVNEKDIREAMRDDDDA